MISFYHRQQEHSIMVDLFCVAFAKGGDGERERDMYFYINSIVVKNHGQSCV